MIIRRGAGILLGMVLALVPVAVAYASVSVSVQSLSPSTSVTVGNSVTFTVVPTGFSNPTYTITDSLSGTSVSNNNISSTGVFTWVPTNSDLGTHNLTVTVSDSQGNTATTQEQLFVSAPAAVAIQSLSPSSSVTSGMTVQFTAYATNFTNPTYTISDSFSGSSISSGNINASGGFVWTPTASQTGTHVITVYVSDSTGRSANVQTTISVGSAPTVIIQSLSPGANVNVGQTVTFTAAASGFSSPTYSLSDSFSGTSINNSDINSSGYFVWSPTSSDTGSHTITVSVVDSSGHTSTATQTITVGGSGSSVQGLSPGNTVIVGNAVSFSVAASGFSNPVFTVQDSFSGSSVSSSAINSAGYFSWTPNTNDVGTHNLTIYINDSSGHTGNVTLAITVQTPNLTITSINPGTSVAPNSVLTFYITPAGLTNPSYTLGDTFTGTSITNSNISSGSFTWTPASNQSGTHTITVYGTDSLGHSANTSITINVNSGVSVALTALSPGTTIAAGTTGTLAAYAYGFIAPTFSISDTFAGSSVTNSNINSSGYLSWTPRASDAGSHVLTVTVSDSYGHTASAQTTITVLGSTVTTGITTTSTGSTATGFVFTSYLTQGMTSTEISNLQTVLGKLGFFTGPISGYFGPLTTASVKKYQQSLGIQQLGVVGPSTRAALNNLTGSSASAPSTTTSTGDGYVFQNFIGVGYSGTDVTELQKRLTALGYFTGSATGYYGSLTQAAVMQFQGAHSINQAGYVGPSTRAALNQ